MPLLKRVGIESVAKITAIYGVVIGLIMGIIVALLSLIVGNFSRMGYLGGAYDTPGFGHFGIFSILAIFILPIVYGLGGLIYGVVMAGLYNTIAKEIGGVVLEFEE